MIGHSQGAPTGRVAITFDAAKNSWGNGRIVSMTSVGGVNKGSKTADALNGAVPSNIQGGIAALANAFDITDPFLGLTALPFGGETNDGLVSECSQRLGEFLGARDANHVDEVNHLLGARSLWHDPVAMYRQQANRLKNAGL